jgi:hypothetical protein
MTAYVEVQRLQRGLSSRCVTRLIKPVDNE